MFSVVLDASYFHVGPPAGDARIINNCLVNTFLGLRVISPLGFKARVGSLISTWQKHMIYIPSDSPLLQHLCQCI